MGDIAGPPLSDDAAKRMEVWVVAATAWGEAAQTLVGAATELATASRELSDGLDPGAPLAVEGIADTDANGLAEGLRLLADRIEGDTRQLRDGYLATAASLDQYRGVLD
jgi:hypothetical protein